MRVLRDIEAVLRDVGSIEDILDRHGYTVRRGMVNCPDPTHEDNSPSAKVIPPAGDYPGRIFCFSCGLNEDPIALARLLGEYVEFTEEVDEVEGKRINLSIRINWRPPRTRQQIQRRTVLTKQFEGDPTIELDWATAKMLASLGNKQSVQREILRNYEYMTENLNLPRVWKLVEALWEYGAKVFGLPNKPDDPRSWKAWVDKVAKELEA